MKPKNWDKLLQSKKRKIALQLLHSARGSYLITQGFECCIGSREEDGLNYRERIYIRPIKALQPKRSFKYESAKYS